MTTMVTATVASDLVERIRTHAQQAYPAECCGFLLGRVDDDQQRTILGVEPVPNYAGDAGGGAAGDDLDRYRISPSDYLRVDRAARLKGWDILGCYHSHPDAPAAPSAIDLADAWPWYLYVIVSVEAGHVTHLAGWTLEEPASSTPRFDAIELEVK